jgi:hypothetical protein
MKPCTIMAYALGDNKSDIRMLSIPLPKKNLYTREELLSFIAQAEKAKPIDYMDFDGTEKDIYVCRPESGEIIEIVPRKEFENRFEKGFAEIESDFLKFDLELKPFKIGKPIEAEIIGIGNPKYEQHSYEYAVANAYNACLLGRVFSREEFQLETKDNCRVKYEVRQGSSKYIDLTTLYVHPEKIEGKFCYQAYRTEPMNVINGDEVSQKIYRIKYDNVKMDYAVEQ